MRPCCVHQTGTNEMQMHLHSTGSLLHTWGLEVQPVLIVNVVSKDRWLDALELLVGFAFIGGCAYLYISRVNFS